jgi:hypothetical protein
MKRPGAVRWVPRQNQLQRLKPAARKLRYGRAEARPSKKHHFGPSETRPSKMSRDSVRGGLNLLAELKKRII